MKQRKQLWGVQYPLLFQNAVAHLGKDTTHFLRAPFVLSSCCGCLGQEMRQAASDPALGLEQAREIQQHNSICL